MSRNAWILSLAVLGLLAACRGAVGGVGETEPEPEPPGREIPPLRESVGPAEYPEARAIRRLTANQFHRALEVATGQSWSQFETYAAALGRPDYAEVTEEGLELSVTFDKLIHDAARATCAQAVAADQAGEQPDAAILRFATVTDRDPTVLGENIKYLYLRFLATEVVDDDDERLIPWLNVVLAANDDGSELTDADMATRWTAVCVGLATHPDFLAY